MGQTQDRGSEDIVVLAPQAAEAAAFFDSLGLGYQHAFEGRKTSQIQAAERLMSRLDPGARVLDVGCGTGLPTAGQLSEGGMDVTGIDVSEGLLAHARRQVPGARFVRADLFDQELDIGPFDAVVSFYSLVDLTADMFIAALERLRDLTVTGGTLLVAVSERRTDDEVRFMDTSYRPALCRREDLGDWARQAGLWVDELNICPEQGAEGQPETGLYLWARRFRDSPPSRSEPGQGAMADR
ncbi:class I SAM-dependent methyltransferase [Streptomyces scopuliridis]|uniref:Methyltransferase n=2 Tax=Streptomyces scopuliridis TaxID=452529 RepID=A0A2T7SXE6_9ACTN|nr:class I SAM-dependent methyltransferase [Streptomyces scopuliridis]PVE07514.1 methyltransferase [Streptomyces scopuliridis RB72]